MKHIIYPHTQTGLVAAAIAIPLVCIFIWFFNSYQMGKFKNSKKITNPKTLTMMIFLFIIIAVVVLSLVI